MKKAFFSALLMGVAAASFAGTTAASSSTVVKWFHFNGDASNPSDLSDPTKYSPAPGDLPTCPDDSQAYRCDIKTLTQETNSDQPNLDIAPMEERTRENAQ